MILRSYVSSARVFAAIALIVINAAYSIAGSWSWIRPLDRFAGRPWPEYGDSQFQPFTKLADRYRPLVPLIEQFRHKSPPGERQEIQETIGFITNREDPSGQRMMAQTLL